MMSMKVKDGEEGQLNVARACSWLRLAIQPQNRAIECKASQDGGRNNLCLAVPSRRSNTTTMKRTIIDEVPMRWRDQDQNK